MSNRIALFVLALFCSGVVAEDSRTQLPAPKHGGVYVVAHRGAHQGIPENTLAAYRKAIELGVDYVEIDLRTTKDGRFVSVHNSTVDDYTGGVKGAVNEMTFDELRALNIGSRVGPEWASERIPAFEEILELCKGKVGIYLDLKFADPVKVIEILRAYGMEKSTLWYTSPPVHIKLKEICPECIPMPDPGVELLLPKLLERIEPVVVAATWDNFSKSFVDTCHAAGAKVIVDESDPSCWQQAFDWKTDGIQTDSPKELIELLDKRIKE